MGTGLIRSMFCSCVWRTQFQFFARNWVQTRGKALFFMALALLFDIALLLTLFLRILVFKSSISFSEVHILFDALVLSVLVVAFLLEIVDMNETTQKDHVHILEAQVGANSRAVRCDRTVPSHRGASIARLWSVRSAPSWPCCDAKCARSSPAPTREGCVSRARLHFCSACVSACSHRVCLGPACSCMR